MEPTFMGHVCWQESMGAHAFILPEHVRGSGRMVISSPAAQQSWCSQLVRSPIVDGRSRRVAATLVVGWAWGVVAAAIALQWLNASQHGSRPLIDGCCCHWPACMQQQNKQAQRGCSRGNA